jgi:hypothetical protein
MALETSYTSRPAGSGTTAAGQSVSKPGDYWPLSKLRKCYTDYLFSKREEIDEQIDARRYYHGSQYTTEQIAALRKRRQPIMTFNRVSRKIDGVVGIIEAKRQDPKAYPRTPQHEEGAELATATLRYVLDDQDWNATSPICAMTAAVDGIGGVELDLIQGDKGDPEISLEEVEIDAFFYDPRSHKPDFSDARYMGVGRWLDDDIAKEMFPDADDNAFSSDDELTSNSDREARWFRSEGVQNRVRVVEIWYRHQGGWCWAVFSGNAVLKEGKSPFKDDMGKDYCKYIMFAGFVDQDGDKYGFVRNLKSPQDGINAKQSKMQHILASKRIILSQGAVDDIEKVRAEWARPDGVVITNRPVNEGVKTDDQSFDFAGWVKMLELNQAEIENFGPNRTLLSEGGVDTRSGRAIAMLKQSGEAELGPFMLAHRGWKIRLYRAIFWAIQQHWQAERYIRVTDNEGLAQFIQINGLQIDPNTGQPTMVNAIGQLDVDVILDEGPDTINMMQDLYETLSQVVPAIAPMLPPPKAEAMVEMLIEVSPLDAAAKKKFREAGQQQTPEMQAQAQLQMEGAVAEVRDKQAAAQLKQAQAVKAMAEAEVAPLEAMMSGQGGTVQPQDYEPPPEIQDAQAIAEIEETRASATLKYAQAGKAQVETQLAPAQLAAEQQNAEADRQMAHQQATEDRKVAQRNADADRKVAMKKATQKPPARR